MAMKTFERSMQKRLKEIDNQLDSVYESMTLCNSTILDSDLKDKDRAMKEYGAHINEYKALLSCQIMIAKNYEDIVDMGKTMPKKSVPKQTVLEQLRKERVAS